MSSKTRPREDAPTANVPTDNTPSEQPQKRPHDDDPKDDAQNKRQNPAPEPVEQDCIRRAMAALFPGYRREKQGIGKLSEARDKLKTYIDETGDNASPREEMTATLLTAFLDFLPEEQGRVNMVADILCADGRKGLEELSDGIINHLIKPLRKAAGATPNLSGERQAFHEGSYIFGTYHVVQHSEGCLYRDFDACAVSGYLSRINSQGEDVGPTWTVDTQALHIIPYRLAPPNQEYFRQGPNLDLYLSQLESRARTWAHIYRYFPAVEHVLDIREYNIINKPRNDIALSRKLYRLMADFRFSLEYQGDEYDPDDLYTKPKYKVLTFEGTTHIDIWGSMRKERDTVIQFGGESRDEIPHPRIVDFHLAIARILDATGLKQRLAEMPEELTEMSGCANDGSTDLGTLVQSSMEDKGVEASEEEDATSSEDVAETGYVKGKEKE